MPTPQIDDRKEIARIAVARGWTVSEVRHHTSPTAELKANKILFEVHYIKDDDAGLVVMYNSIDKMVSAHLQAGSRQDHAYRLVTVVGWLEDYGDPEEEVRVGGGRAVLLRDKRTVAEAFYNADGAWVIRLRDNSSATISVKGLPEPTQRRIVIAALKAL